jgi:two-component system, OmpR family, sensor kinase
MKRTRSITVRLSLVFLVLFLQVVLLAVFSVGSLSYFNRASSQVSERWLPSTRLLGDLNNMTSDYRVAEATLLLASDTHALEESDQQLEKLDIGISAAGYAYRRIEHEAAEQQLYEGFAREWEEYRQAVQRGRQLLLRGDSAGARALYNTTSKGVYDTASRTFDRLNDLNGAGAREASSRQDAAFRRARKIIAFAILVALLSVIAAMAYVRTAISAPVLTLAQRMHRLAANETAMEVEGTEREDEVGEMARAVVVFRNNALELMSGRRALEQQASMLKEKLAEEQRLMQLQRNFLLMASHEFRTPLTLIDGQAQRLISIAERHKPQDVIERAAKIRSAVQRITQLIGNLIDASRVTDGDVQLYFHPARLDLVALLRETCQLQREITPHAQIFENFPRQPVALAGDAGLLAQVFTNLLSNAVKYSPDAGLIKVTVACDGPGCSVTVEDSGIGVPKEECGRVFERYFRGSNASGITGTGVGLYFVKMVVELHGGLVWMTSAPGEGSLFTVRLPLSAELRNEPGGTTTAAA